jgi:hypothetical protein
MMTSVGNKKYFVYIDWTEEEVPRPFYVGKGNAGRVSFKKRNTRHNDTSIKYGMKRVVVFETDDQDVAYDEEIKLIAECHTFFKDPSYNGVGCNLTIGGGGTKRINCKRVAQYDLDDNVVQTFNSLQDAANSVNAASQSLSDAIKGIRKNVIFKGFKWKFIDDSGSKKRRDNHTQINCKSVNKCDLHDNVLETFVSVSAAAKICNVSRIDMGRYLRGIETKITPRIHERLMLDKFKWKFSNDVDINPTSWKMSEEGRKTISEAIKGIKRSQETRDKLRKCHSKPVLKCDMNDVVVHVYASVKEAEESENAKRSAILDALHSKNNVWNGYVWKFKYKKHCLRQGFKMSDESRQKIRESKGCRFIMTNLETGEQRVFISKKECCETLGLTARQMDTALRATKSDLFVGYEFKTVSKDGKDS